MGSLWQQLDEAFPTLVRYAGLAIMLYSTVVDRVERPSIAVAATGMILFKTVLGERKPPANGNGNGHSDRWSGLP